MKGDRTRPASHYCEQCGERWTECECGDWLPASVLFDEPDDEEDE